MTGLQAQGVAATPKHFVCNESETSRQMSNSVVAEKVLRELYLLPFQICIKKSNPWALMTAYNKVNGEWCSENTHLLKHIVRDEWKYDGCVMSDFGGVYTDVRPVTEGLNLEMPGPSIHRGQELLDNIKAGRVPESAIDENAAKVIELAWKVGMEDEDAPEQASIDRHVSALIREAAAEGVVLLKNDNCTLPLATDKGLKVAVFGAPASMSIIHGGGSSSVSPHYVVTPLEALRESFPELKYEYGVPIFRKIPSAPIDCMKTMDGRPGVDCHWYNGWSFGKNEILHERLESTRTLVIDPRIPGLQSKHCTRMEFTLTPRTTGSHTFGVTACGETHIYVNGKEVVSHDGFLDTRVEQIMQPGLFEKRASIDMVGGVGYHVVIDTLSTLAPPPPPPAFQIAPQATQVGFFENLEREDMDVLEDLARESDVSIVFTGNNKEWESESFDREALSLSKEQDAMVSRVAAASKRTVVVNQTGAPISMPWVDQVDAIVQNWFAGMETGNAVADILTGKVSPSGKLPTTFPVRIEDVPANANFPCDSHLNVHYAEGLRVGYRALGEPGVAAPLFPFGHGLSYATFEYANPSITRSGCVIYTVTVDVTNVSERDGKETVQVYVDGLLKGFTKILVPAGKTVNASLELDRIAFSSWNEKEAAWEVEAKAYVVDFRRDALTTILSNTLELPSSDKGFWQGL